jgi:hypothetical protein
MNNNEPLISLLRREKTDIIVAKCLALLSTGTGVIETETNPVPLHEIRNTYARRAQGNRIRNSHIEGFDKLIPSLNTSKETLVVVHVIRVGEETFSVFTDPSSTTLIGILAIPDVNRANEVGA